MKKKRNSLQGPKPLKDGDVFIAEGLGGKNRPHTKCGDKTYPLSTKGPLEHSEYEHIRIPHKKQKGLKAPVSYLVKVNSNVNTDGKVAVGKISKSWLAGLGLLSLLLLYLL